jgi:hypothetical protein
MLKKPRATRRAAPPRPALAPTVALCTALSGLSLLMPSAPTTDPWGWIVWGREAAQLELNTAVGGAPAWKPLPVLLTTPLSLSGGAAPLLWLLLARAGGLLSLALAFRVGTRLAGPLAGLVAALALALSGSWLRQLAHGYSEPLTAALLLGALDRHLDARKAQAYFLCSCAALARPELWPLALGYGAVCLWRQGSRALVVAGSLALPALWLVPDWLGSGDLLHGIRATRATVGAGPAAAVEALTIATERVGVLVVVLAGLAALLAVRQRERPTLGLAALAVLSAVGLFVAMLAGYPGSERYFILPTVLVCVLAGAGVALAVMFPARAAARLGVAIALAVVALPWLGHRTAHSAEVIRASIARAELQADLRMALARAGGAPRVLRLGRPALPRGLSWTEGVLAWELDVPLARVAALRSSAGTLVKGLSSEQPFETPARARTAAAIRPLPVSGPLVVFAPFGDTPLVDGARHRRRLKVVAAAGRWRVAILRSRRDRRAA